MANLELVPLNDLVTEMLTRCDHGVIVLLQCGQPAPDDTTRMRRFKGNALICTGLASDAAFWISKEQWRKEREVEMR